MKTTVMLAISAVIVLGACSPFGNDEQAANDKTAQAQLMAAHHSIEHMGAWLLTEMDADKNGIVTRAEREASAHREWFLDFSKVDLNGDGQLTKDEYIRALRIKHPSGGGLET